MKWIKFKQENNLNENCLLWIKTELNNDVFLGVIKNEIFICFDNDFTCHETEITNYMLIQKPKK